MSGQPCNGSVAISGGGNSYRFLANSLGIARACVSVPGCCSVSMNSHQPWSMKPTIHTLSSLRNVVVQCNQDGNTELLNEKEVVYVWE